MRSLALIGLAVSKVKTFKHCGRQERQLLQRRSMCPCEPNDPFELKKVYGCDLCYFWIGMGIILLFSSLYVLFGLTF